MYTNVPGEEVSDAIYVLPSVLQDAAHQTAIARASSSSKTCLQLNIYHVQDGGSALIRLPRELVVMTLGLEKVPVQLCESMPEIRNIIGEGVKNLR